MGPVAITSQRSSRLGHWMTGVQTLPQTKYMDVAWSPGETMLSELDRGEERGFEIVLGSGERVDNTIPYLVGSWHE